ncbi:MAG: PIN domain-containing protein [Deltaproteobacteria bacterium]|nr:PIN domain-containing protein [Deltaproteobacteria bacterium]
MKAVDTNILLYAHRKESAHHRLAYQVLLEMSEGVQPWAIPWPCCGEFLRVATHPSFYDPPTSIGVALANLESLLESPTVSLIGETERHQAIFFDTIRRFHIRGNLIFDAKIYAICREHGVSEIVTADAHFLRFDHIRVTNPFR